MKNKVYENMIHMGWNLGDNNKEKKWQEKVGEYQVVYSLTNIMIRRC